MRAHFLVFAAFIALSVGGCGAKQAEQPAVPAGPQYMPEATIKDLMDSIIDPNADYIWNATGTVDTLGKPVVVRTPHTDADWDDLRHHAIALVEGTNLLLIPGRIAAHVGDKPDDPNIVEDPNIINTPDQILQLINGDRTAWGKHVRALHDSALVTLKAIEAKDPQAMLDNGDKMDSYCEGCHISYWYPKDAASKGLYDESVKTLKLTPVAPPTQAPQK